jgi:hypothetical protein
MTGEYLPFEDALKNFYSSAPPGARPTAIRAGEHEFAAFREWMATHPSGTPMQTGASFSGAGTVAGYYANLPIERAATGSYLCIVGKTPDGSTIECPDSV